MDNYAGVYTVHVHDEGPGEDLWAEVDEMPGCFASGRDMRELREALAEAIGMLLSDTDQPLAVEVHEKPGKVTEMKVQAIPAA